MQLCEPQCVDLLCVVKNIPKRINYIICIGICIQYIVFYCAGASHSFYPFSLWWLRLSSTYCQRESNYVLHGQALEYNSETHCERERKRKVKKREVEWKLRVNFWISLLILLERSKKKALAPDQVIRVRASTRYIRILCALSSVVLTPCFTRRCQGLRGWDEAG